MSWATPHLPLTVWCFFFKNLWFASCGYSWSHPQNVKEEAGISMVSFASCTFWVLLTVPDLSFSVLPYPRYLLRQLPCGGNILLDGVERCVGEEGIKVKKFGCWIAISQYIPLCHWVSKIPSVTFALRQKVYWEAKKKSSCYLGLGK